MSPRLTLEKSDDQAAKIGRKFTTFIVATTVVPLLAQSTLAQEKSDNELVKELANPISSLISVPFQTILNSNSDPTMTVLSTRSKLSELRWDQSPIVVASCFFHALSLNTFTLVTCTSLTSSEPSFSS